MEFVTVKLYTATRNNAKLAAALLRVPMVRFIHDAVMEKIEREVWQVASQKIEWEQVNDD